MENLELAQEALEKAHQRGEAKTEGATEHSGATRLDKWAAILVAIMASVAVVVEMTANDTQVAYLAAHISASDTWSQYQAKSVRRALYTEVGDVLTAQAGPTPDDAQAKRIANAHDQADRMLRDPGKHDGMEELAAQAHQAEARRDHELRLHDSYELSARTLQIGIVLSGLFIVTELLWLLIAGGALGVLASLYALLIAGGLA